jgi:hypothetical protein|tara:strand:+ start:595 stop:831 length:237 start_codon:yes stop_codon:yes gene_type:complete
MLLGKSFNLFNLANCPASAVVMQILFDGFSAPAGSRIIKPGRSFAADAKPKYVTFALDGKLAYATLLENNAVAIIDIN